ncbi:MAG: hypothetical protein AAB316_12350, partial [Bacteroidota bacterium]
GFWMLPLKNFQFFNFNIQKPPVSFLPNCKPTNETSHNYFKFFPKKDTAKQTLFSTLLRDDYVHLTLHTDFRQLNKSKKDPSYLPAKLTVLQPDSTFKIWDTEIRPRGKMRRRICENPPLRFKFSKRQLLDAGLDSAFNNFELSLICEESDAYEQYILREYVAYRLSNLLTEHSVRVVLAKVRYVDVNGKDAPKESFGILIEDKDELANRLGGQLLSPILSDRVINSDPFERFALFEYMIGNTDWYPYTGHNVIWFGISGTVTPIPIPYDFDYSGLVSTPYSVPDERLGLASVNERFYQGRCRKKEETMKSIGLFLEKKQALLGFCEQFPHFSEKSRKHVVSYVKSFFEIIESQGKTKNLILQHCDLWMKF